MQIALVGYSGYWGSKLARVIKECGHEIVREIDKANSDDIDLVEAEAAVIATPPETHCDLAIRAMRNGMDVLVEKPMALSGADALRMHKIAEEEGRVLAVDHTWLHTQVFGLITQTKEPLVMYQSLRLSRPMAHVTTPAGWDLIVHDFAILEALGELWGHGQAGEAGGTATTVLELSNRGSAFIMASRNWPYKERTVVLHYPSKTYIWQPGELKEATKNGTSILLRDTTEPLANVINDFSFRCEKRLMTGIADGARGVAICTYLGQLFPLK